MVTISLISSKIGLRLYSTVQNNVNLDDLFKWQDDYLHDNQLLVDNYDKVHDTLLNLIQQDEKNHAYAKKFINSKLHTIESTVTQGLELKDFLIELQSILTKLNNSKNNIDKKVLVVLSKEYKNNKINKIVAATENVLTEVSVVHSTIISTSQDNIQNLQNVKSRHIKEQSLLKKTLNVIRGQCADCKTHLQSEPSRKIILDYNKMLHMTKDKIYNPINDLYNIDSNDLYSNLVSFQNKRQQIFDKLEQIGNYNKKKKIIHDKFEQMTKTIKNILNKLSLKIADEQKKNPTKESEKLLRQYKESHTNITLFLEKFNRIDVIIKEIQSVIEILVNGYKELFPNKASDFIINKLPEQKKENSDLLIKIEKNMKNILDKAHIYLENYKPITQPVKQVAKDISRTALDEFQKKFTELSNSMNQLNKAGQDIPLIEKTKHLLQGINNYKNEIKDHLTTEELVNEFVKKSKKAFVKIEDNLLQIKNHLSKLKNKTKKTTVKHINKIANTIPKIPQKTKQVINSTIKKTSISKTNKVVDKKSKNTKRPITGIHKLRMSYFSSHKFIMVLFLILVAIFILIIRIILRKKKTQ